ncbi:MAG: helix-turn-helix transcriptional regulator, partial [Owenweeksia sp.]
PVSPSFNERTDAMSSETDTRNRINRTIGAQLHFARLYVGLSLQELSNKADITADQLQGYEEGWGDIPVATVYQIAKALNISPANFMLGLSAYAL